MHAFTKAYLKHFASEYSNVSGTNLPLNDLYVLLETIKNSDTDITPTSERMEHVCLPTDSTDLDKEKPQSIGQVLAQARHITLIGEPGSGKSTTMQFIGLCFTNPEWVKEKLSLNETGIPVMIKLKYIGESLKNDEKNVFENVIIPNVKNCINDVHRTDPEIREEVIRWIDKGELILLLDGLDEITDDRIKSKVIKFLEEKNSFKYRIILSSRPAGYSSVGQNFEEYRLKPFSKKEDILKFIKNWMIGRRPEWQEGIEEKANNLLRGLRKNDSFEKITDNPLLLRLAVENYCIDEMIAENRVNLYKRYVESAVWENREELRIISEDKRAPYIAPLESYAWRMLGGEKITWDDKKGEMVFLRKRLGLISIYSENDTSYITFNHLTFQEYFVARYLASFWEITDAKEIVWKTLKPLLHDPHWQEPLKLLVMILKDKDRNEFIRRVLRAKSKYEKDLQLDLVLATSLAAECGKQKINSDLWQELEVRVSKAIERGFEGSEMFGIFALPVLRSQLMNRDPNKRRSVVYALGQIGDSLVIPDLIPLLKDEDREVRWSVTRILGQIGGSSMISDLKTLLKDEDAGMRGSVIDVLGETRDSSMIFDLIPLLKDEDADVRSSAVGALGQIGDRSVIPDLKTLLKDEDSGVRMSAVVALCQIGDSLVIPDLMPLLKDKNSGVRRLTVLSIGKIGDSSVISGLIPLLKDEDTDVRSSAAVAFGLNRDTSVLPDLKPLLNDDDAGVQGSAIYALGLIGDSSVIPDLMPLLKDGNEFVRRTAVYALGQIGDCSVIPDLKLLLKDEEAGVRRLAAVTLGKIGDCYVIPNLIPLLKDLDEDVRLGTQSTITKLILNNSQNSINLPDLDQSLKDARKRKEYLKIVKEGVVYILLVSLIGVLFLFSEAIKEIIISKISDILNINNNVQTIFLLIIVFTIIIVIIELIKLGLSKGE